MWGIRVKCKAKRKACQADSCQWPKTDAKLIWGPICQTFALNCKFRNYRNFSLKYHAVSEKDPSDNQGYNYSGGDETCSITYTSVDAVYLTHLVFFFLFTLLSFQIFYKFLGQVIYVTLPILLYKRTSVPRTKENLSGDWQPANHCDW